MTDAGRRSSAESGAAEAPVRLELKGKDRRHLRALGATLRPVVFIGKEGLTEAVVRAVDQAHQGSELLKLKILDPGDVDRKAIAAELDATSGSQVVGMVGGTILLYRRNPQKPRIAIPSLGESLP